MPSYCIDATALVIYITEKKSLGQIKKIMNEIESGKSKGIMSVVNLAEFHRAMTRISTEAKADMYVTWLKESKMEMIPPTIEIAVLASIKKQKYASAASSFAWDDAFCLATAIEYQSDYILTADTEFENVREIPIIYY